MADHRVAPDATTRRASASRTSAVGRLAFTTSANGIELVDEGSCLPVVGVCSGEAELGTGEEVADSGVRCFACSDA